MKENNPLMAHQSSTESDEQIPCQPLGSNNPHPSSKHVVKMEHQQEAPFFLSTLICDDDDRDKDVRQNPSTSASKTHLSNKEEIPLQEVVSEESVVEKDSGRERLKRHRIEVAGRVWIPEIWGQEELLKDWKDCTAFDAPLVPSRITTARTALIEEGRRANAAGLRIENRC